MFRRTETRPVSCGGLTIGGGAPVSIQSMTNTDTRDAGVTVRQILELEKAGCDIVRVAVPDIAAAEAVREIKKKIGIPLVCDIHFDYRLALACVDNGADKIRINPGNIGSPEKTRAVTEKCKAAGVPIRIGVNSGSVEKRLLEKYGGPTPQALFESAAGHIKLLEDEDFHDIVVSIKASDVNTSLEAYRLTAENYNYPLHVGITEAGTVRSGTVKSCVGLGAILSLGIGDTIRVSLTGDPVEEVRVAKEALRALGLRRSKLVDFTSCPTCGRTEVDLIRIAETVEKGLEAMEAEGVFKTPVRVAVMGCAVNGPGEAREADVGIAGGKGFFLLFENGEIIGKIDENGAAEKFLGYVKNKFS
ncbi:MAG: flavodoxin-dependent (E)-4-hydroxy-3-methylbut-2-enyl-diphosphate synthase [Clostridia bacterium]|nr:flavodoxin-dependent (E)-4-hydroxy-3-methylbut-2-enyl-diphosphate synthase [Clostridia bacterium]